MSRASLDSDLPNPCMMLFHRSASIASSCSLASPSSAPPLQATRGLGNAPRQPVSNVPHAARDSPPIPPNVLQSRATHSVDPRASRKSVLWFPLQENGCAPPGTFALQQLHQIEPLAHRPHTEAQTTTVQATGRNTRRRDAVFLPLIPGCGIRFSVGPCDAIRHAKHELEAPRRHDRLPAVQQRRVVHHNGHSLVVQWGHKWHQNADGVLERRMRMQSMDVRIQVPFADTGISRTPQRLPDFKR